MSCTIWSSAAAEGVSEGVPATPYGRLIHPAKVVRVSSPQPEPTATADTAAPRPPLVPQAEHDVMFGGAKAYGSLWPATFSGLKDSKTIILKDKEYDVFGDGTVIMLRTPGHTPGHSALLVKLPQAGAFILTGDAVHFRENYDSNGVPAFRRPESKNAATTLTWMGVILGVSFFGVSVLALHPSSVAVSTRYCGQVSP